MAQSRVRLAVVGAGRWGRNLIRAFQAVPGCEVAAVCDSSPKRLACATIPSAARRLDALEPVLEDHGICAVAIATPPGEHAVQALAALGAGKHVFVEKPMALTVRDAIGMRDAAIRADRCLMIGHLLRYHPAIVELRRLIDAGGLGAVREAAAFRLGPPTRRSDADPWWSLAPHDLSLVRHLLRSEIVAVSARDETRGRRGAEIAARLRLTSGGASVVVSTAQARKTRLFFAVGSERTALFDDSGPAPTLRVFPTLAGHLQDRTPDSPSSWLEFARSAHAEFVPVPSDEPLLCEARHFVSAILEGTRIVTDADEGCRVVAGLEAGSRSLVELGRWISTAAPSRYESLDPGAPS